MIAEQETSKNQCPHCKESIENVRAKFCPYCGEKLEDTLLGSSIVQSPAEEIAIVEKNQENDKSTDIGKKRSEDEVTTYNIDATAAKNLAVGENSTAITTEEANLKIDSKNTTFKAENIAVYFVEEQLIFSPIMKEREKAETIFVEPENYREILEYAIKHDNHIFVVYGLDESDKNLYAIKLGGEHIFHERPPTIFLS